MVVHQWLFFLSSLYLFTLIHVSGAEFHHRRAFLSEMITLVVDPSGCGNFTTIQAAIDAVPFNNIHWIRIQVTAATYKEKVEVDENKPYIYLKGEGMKMTTIVWDDHDTVSQSPTFSSRADHFFAEDISFVNSYNLPVTQTTNPRAPAAAAMISCSECSFHRCGFYGIQDTLWDYSGKHYFKKCTIMGAVDFIFGRGQSIYERCNIVVAGGALGAGISGFITAQGRQSMEETNGFVFKRCKISGSGSAFLGRPWRSYARVIFYKTNMSSVITPLGWDSWYSTSYEERVTFVEEQCSGEGSNKKARVKWEKKLSQEEMIYFTSMKFIDAHMWIGFKPFNHLLN